MTETDGSGALAVAVDAVAVAPLDAEDAEAELLLIKFINTRLLIVLVRPFSNVIYPFKMSLVAFIYEFTKVIYASSVEFERVGGESLSILK
jgi:threonine/homoserine efflux transporter RhtA